jgi:hypothetical protein
MFTKRINQIIAGVFLAIGGLMFVAGFWGHPVVRSNGSSRVIGLTELGFLVLIIGVLVLRIGSRK